MIVRCYEFDRVVLQEPTNSKLLVLSVPDFVNYMQGFCKACRFTYWDIVLDGTVIISKQEV